jgi:hypothetical protein
MQGPYPHTKVYVDDLVGESDVMVQLGECFSCFSDAFKPSVHRVESCDCCARVQFAAFLTPSWDRPVPRPGEDTMQWFLDHGLPPLHERFGSNSVLTFHEFSRRSTSRYWKGGK